MWSTIIKPQLANKRIGKTTSLFQPFGRASQTLQTLTLYFAYLKSLLTCELHKHKQNQILSQTVFERE